MAVHGTLAAGAGSGRPESHRRCVENQRYALGGFADDGYERGVSSVSLDAALVRDAVDAPDQRGALVRAGLLASRVERVSREGDGSVARGPRALELQAGLSIVTARGAGAVFAAHPPRPGPAARKSIRRAARRAVDDRAKVVLAPRDGGGFKATVTVPEEFQACLTLAARRGWRHACLLRLLLFL